MKLSQWKSQTPDNIHTLYIHLISYFHHSDAPLSLRSICTGQKASEAIFSDLLLHNIRGAFECPPILTPVSQCSVPLDPVSICDSGLFSFLQPPQVNLYLANCGLNLVRKPRPSVCRIHAHRAFEKCQWVSTVMTCKRSSLKYCILGWLTSLFNLEIGSYPLHPCTNTHRLGWR